MQDSMNCDFVIVGAGPAGLSAAIRLAQLGQANGTSPSICVLEKGESVGAHILSGAVLEPRALNVLLPDWRDRQPPEYTPVTEDQFLFFAARKHWRLPTPPQMRNHGNFIISLGEWCKWLAEQAEQLGVNIFPGFAAADFLQENGKIAGIITGDRGRNKDGEPGPRFQPGMAIRARQTLIAEGCRGFLAEQIMKQFDLRRDCSPQTYALGIKEIWEIPTTLHKPGLVVHSVGWPLPHTVYGGSFLYHAEENRLAIGFVTGLDYKNPWLNPFELFQQFKTHPLVAPLLANSKRLAYGARCLNEGGWQSLPRLVFPGGALTGCAAGFLNVPKIRGIHTAMASGMLAAESIFSAGDGEACKGYPEKIRNSWIHAELYRARNIRPGMRWGLLPGLLHAAIDTWLLRGRAPWTLKHGADHTALKHADSCSRPGYPPHNHQTTLDISEALWLSHLRHEENQPVHLKLRDPAIPVTVNLKQYAAPEQRYCPAGVYEIMDADKSPHLQIHAANCLHCKACDIKDPTQNICWTPPEGGSGPRYEKM